MKIKKGGPMTAKELMKRNNKAENLRVLQAETDSFSVNPKREKSFIK